MSRSLSVVILLLFASASLPAAEKSAAQLDPHNTQECTVRVPLDVIGFPWGSRFVVQDLLNEQSYMWSEYNFIRLDPNVQPAHILRIEGGPR